MGRHVCLWPQSGQPKLLQCRLQVAIGSPCNATMDVTLHVGTVFSTCSTLASWTLQAPLTDMLNLPGLFIEFAVFPVHDFPAGNEYQQKMTMELLSRGKGPSCTAKNRKALPRIGKHGISRSARRGFMVFEWNASSDTRYILDLWMC